MFAIIRAALVWFLVLACAPSVGLAQTPAPGEVVGRVVDDAGRPIEGAEIFIGYQSLSGGRYGGYGASHNRTGITGRDGTYRIRIANMAPGEYAAYAKATIVRGGQRIVVDLTPDDPSNFASSDATVRNFRLAYAETRPDSDYGTGGTVVVNTAIGDYTPREEITMTLRPANGGAAISRPLRSTGEGWVVTGVPHGTYQVSALHQGRPLLVRPLSGGGWQPTYVGQFERTGPGIYQMRLEVKRP